MNNDHDTTNDMPADVRSIASLLDSCGEAERSMPDARFEARIAAATLPVAGLKQAGLKLAGSERQASAPNRSASLWSMRLAAAVALCGGLIAVRMATMNNVPMTGSIRTSPLVSSGDVAGDDSADVAFALVGWTDDSSSLDDLRTRADSLRTSIDEGVDFSELIGSEEGAT